ncbi:hypothetical protein AGMMS49983_20330 [Clostridia bacterium]|nr:hypothetical protein AGMMS49983_20330 [Clostridia bacterium]
MTHMVHTSEIRIFSKICGLLFPGTRRIALLFCILFLSVSLLSTAFILTRSAHEHDRVGQGGSCATCAHITAAEKLLNTLGIALTGIALSSAIRHLVISARKPIVSDVDFFTPISLKVRLNN